MKKPKVLIGLPTMASIHTMLLVTITAWMAEAFNGGAYNLSIYPTVCVQPVDNARNDIVKAFLESDCTHLLFIDADTIPPLDTITKLLAHNLPIVSAITPIIEMDAVGNPYRKWNAVDMNDDHMKPNTGLNECKGVGASCILIKREVFEKMTPPYYRFTYSDDTGKSVVVGEDIYFTINAISKGIKTYADTSILCQHYKNFLF
jgi:hypothetical protein